MKIIRKNPFGETYCFSCTAALVWSLVSSGGSRVDGVVSNSMHLLCPVAAGHLGKNLFFLWAPGMSSDRRVLVLVLHAALV